MTHCFTYCMPTQIRFEAGLFRRLKKNHLPGERVLIISGENADGSYGFTDLLKNILTEQQVNHIVCGGVRGIISSAEASRIEQISRAQRCDCIVALGGAACINAAKLVAILCTNEGAPEDYTQEDVDKCTFRHAPLPIVCIPTVAEIASLLPYTFFLSADGIRQITDKRLYAHSCLTDPGITITLPPRQTGQLGFIALLAAMGVMLTAEAPLPARVLATHAWEQLRETLPHCTTHGKEESIRYAVSAATLLAAMAGATCPCPPEIATALAICTAIPACPLGATLCRLAPAWHAKAEATHPQLYKKALHLPHSIETELLKLLHHCGLASRPAGSNLDAAALHSALTRNTAYLENIFNTAHCLLSADERLQVVEDSLLCGN